MSTIQQLIKGYANLYQEKADQAQPGLSAMDFLADIARDKAIHSCEPDMRCAFGRLESYRADPDAFIDSYLGAKESTARMLYERQAREMFRIAQKYSSSTSDDSAAHPFRKELGEVEERYRQCSQSLGLAGRVGKLPVKTGEKMSFEKRLDACLAPAADSEFNPFGCSLFEMEGGFCVKKFR